MGRDSLSRASARPAAIQSSPERGVSGVSWPNFARKSGPIAPLKSPYALESKLKIAAKIDKVDRAYWTNVIEPMVACSPNVEYVGEIGERDKAEFLGKRGRSVFPIDWPEPFGLVMIEAMACGTPVIAFRRGSAPEVIDEGVSGFIVEDVPRATAAVQSHSVKSTAPGFEKLSNVASISNAWLGNM